MSQLVGHSRIFRLFMYFDLCTKEFKIKEWMDWSTAGDFTLFKKGYLPTHHRKLHTWTKQFDQKISKTVVGVGKTSRCLHEDMFQKQPLKSKSIEYFSTPTNDVFINVPFNYRASSRFLKS